MIAKLPMEWIDRLFDRLEAIYQDKWRAYYSNPQKISLYKSIWSTGLSGLTPEEIRNALAKCYSNTTLPNPITFYHMAKNLGLVPKPKEEKITWKRGSEEIAKTYLDAMKKELAVPRRT